MSPRPPPSPRFARWGRRSGGARWHHAHPPSPALQGGEGAAEAYVVRCACDPGLKRDGVQTAVDPIRLFPLREDLRWTY